MPESVSKYFRLKGRADIRMAPSGKIELYLYDPLTETEIINPDNPFIFTNIPSEEHPLKFLSVNIIAELGIDSFIKYQPVLQRLDPLVTWSRAEVPDEETMDDMNSTDPPK